MSFPGSKEKPGWHPGVGVWQGPLSASAEWPSVEGGWAGAPLPWLLCCHSCGWPSRRSLQGRSLTYREGRVPRASQHTHEHIQYFMHPNTCVHKVPRASQHTHTQAHTVPQAAHTCMCVHMVFARPLLKHWTLRLPVAGSWLCFVFMSILGNLLIFGRNTSAL